MEKSVDSTHPDFWTSRYAAGKMPWDFAGVPAALKSFLARSSASGKVLIPGCGSGYEVQAFHEAGYDVTAIDFSPAAVDQAKKVLGVLAERVIFGDFFTQNFGQGRFDLIYERRLIGVFLYRQQSESPPYPITDKQVDQLFQRCFRLVRSELVTDSLPLFRGMERWQEWLKID